MARGATRGSLVAEAELILPTAADPFSSPIVFKTPKPGYVIQSPDGSPFTRSMIQHDLLQALFSDETQAFTPPPGAAIAPRLQQRQLLTFRELYEESYLNSSKITKRVRDSMRYDAGFAKDHLMVRLSSSCGPGLHPARVPDRCTPFCRSPFSSTLARSTQRQHSTQR